MVSLNTGGPAQTRDQAVGKNYMPGKLNTPILSLPPSLPLCLFLFYSASLSLFTWCAHSLLLSLPPSLSLFLSYPNPPLSFSFPRPLFNFYPSSPSRHTLRPLDAHPRYMDQHASRLAHSPLPQPPASKTKHITIRHLMAARISNIPTTRLTRGEKKTETKTERESLIPKAGGKKENRISEKKIKNTMTDRFTC